MHVRKMVAGTETEHARSVSHCVLHLFLNSKQRTKLETVNSDGIYFCSCHFCTKLTSRDLKGAKIKSCLQWELNSQLTITGLEV